MAFIRCKEISESTPIDIRDNLGRDYERIFRAEFNAFNHSSAEAVLNTPIFRGEPYVSPNGSFIDPMAIAISLDAKREDEFSNNFIVTIKYSTKPWEDVIKALASGGLGHTGSTPGSPHGGTQDGNSPLNPLNRPWKISHSTSRIRRRMYKDFSTPSKALCNSAGDPIYYEREMPIRVITVTRNVPVPTVSQQILLEDMIGTVNEADFLGRLAGTVKCERIDGTVEYEENQTFWSQTIEFHVKDADGDDPAADAWKLKIVDNGTHEIDDDGFRVPIVDQKNHLPVTDNVPLNGDGQPLSVADIQAGNFHYLSFVEFPPADFSIFGLG